jgi:hypothetical protein
LGRSKILQVFWQKYLMVNILAEIFKQDIIVGIFGKEYLMGIFWQEHLG